MLLRPWSVTGNESEEDSRISRSPLFNYLAWRIVSIRPANQ